MSYHLYEILLESSQMWVKIQAPCVSVEQAMAYFGGRFGGEDPDYPVPVRPRRTFNMPTKLSKCIESIANWESVKTPSPRAGMSMSSDWLGNPTLGVRP